MIDEVLRASVHVIHGTDRGGRHVSIFIDPVAFLGTTPKFLRQLTKWDIRPMPYARTADLGNVKGSINQRYCTLIQFIVDGWDT